MSDDPKNPVDQVLDLLVFAPVGLLSLVREQLPSVVERGRQQVQGQMMMARMMGEFAVQQGRKEAEKAVRDVVDRLNPPAPGPAPDDSRARAEATPSPSPAPKASSNGAAAGGDTRTAGRDDALAIPGYDSLSASQVVPRLAGLSADELEAVRQYESGTRGRRTILNKIAQLQSTTSN